MACVLTLIAHAGAGDPSPAGIPRRATPAPASQPARPPGPPPAPGARPVDAIRRVLIVSVDGLRPDLLARADAPNVRRLMRGGAFTLWARTTAASRTLPSHVSMLTGVTPPRHEIEWNRDLPLARPLYPRGRTLFDIAHQYGYTTALVAGKSKFGAPDHPGSIDWKWIAPRPATRPSTAPTTTARPASEDEWPDDGMKAKKEELSDAAVASRAARIIRDHRPDVAVVHLPHVDNVGHLAGWGTPDRVRAVEDADLALGQVLRAVEEAGLAPTTLVILTADHGGAGRTHGPDDPRSRHIPWIAFGPGVRRGFDLTRFPDLTVNTEDTFATACYVLGMRPAPHIDGKPVREIVCQEDLLHASE
jgi:arylsulfatase A-like enzyme